MATNTSSGFTFERKNYFLMFLGLVIIILGYVLMSGGGSKDPNVFSYEIFSARRITAAPIVVLLGYGLIGYSIMFRPKSGIQNSKPAKANLK